MVTRCAKACQGVNICLLDIHDDECNSNISWTDVTESLVDMFGYVWVLAKWNKSHVITVCEST